MRVVRNVRPNKYLVLTYFQKEVSKAVRRTFQKKKYEKGKTESLSVRNQIQDS